MGTRMRPLIGITTSEVRVPDHVTPAPQADPPRREMALGMKYTMAIEAADGLPVVMPPMHDEAIDPLLDRLSGVVLSGGPDMDPGTYGGRYHPQLGPTEPDLDHFELELVKAVFEAQDAAARDLPRRAGAERRARRRPVSAPARGSGRPGRPSQAHGGRPRHRARREGRAGQLCSSEAIHRDGSTNVNSFHHQAAHRIGRGLVAVAWAPDGVVEALELPDRDFTVGVQWHAEAMVDRPEQLALFQSFVQAASRYDAPPARVRSAA